MRVFLDRSEAVELCEPERPVPVHEGASGPGLRDLVRQEAAESRPSGIVVRTALATPRFTNQTAAVLTA